MTDRLALIKARHAEAGGGDADKQWLIEQVERLRRILRGPGRARKDRPLTPEEVAKRDVRDTAHE